jgi:3-oxoacyl-[acyl-carrier protein] reductase
MSDGRVALVTGGSRGIGLASARRLQGEGYRVAVTWRTSPPEPLEGPEGTLPLFPVRCDVASTQEVDDAFGEVERTLGNVEVLVCSAGITEDTLLLMMSEEKWQRVLDTNLTSVYRTAKRAASRMVRARYGRIILLSSVVAYLGSAGQTNYAASKAALVGFGRSLARELAGRNITVNVVAPGVVTTDMTAALGDERLDALVSLVPLQRAAVPDEVANAVAWLAADESAYITGAVIPVDGGLGMGH